MSDFKGIENFTTHIFQAVSATIEPGCNPPAAVITTFLNSMDVREYFVSPMKHFNHNTRVAYYQGYNVIDRHEIIKLCAGDRTLEKNKDISVFCFCENAADIPHRISEFKEKYDKESNHNPSISPRR